jgi:hypothetical protein
MKANLLEQENIMKKLSGIVFLLLGLFCSSAHAYTMSLKYNGKCQFTLTREKYAYCLQKELVAYDNEFSTLYRNLPPERALPISEALTQIVEPDCDALAKKTGGGVEYNIIFRTCLINIQKEKIACIRRFTSCQNCRTKFFNVFRKPFIFFQQVSINLSDPS